MPDIAQRKKDIISIGRLLWEKDLVSGLNGNISLRVDEDMILITAHGTCLGLLQEKDILLMRLSTAELLEEGQVSTENRLHVEIYRRFAQTQAVMHTHTTYTNAYFLEHTTLTPRVFEAQFYLGEVRSVEQKTPSVTELDPVMKAFETNNLVVLRRHGVVTRTESLFDGFLLIQALEEAAKIELLRRLCGQGSRSEERGTQEDRCEKTAPTAKTYEVFSTEQIDEIVRLVNADAQLSELGRASQMNLSLAVKMDETGQVYRFVFQEGRIVEVGRDEEAEFVISAPRAVWKAVFNRELDPFVATTQKKMRLRGDFARISQWYTPCSRLFELWAQVPVE